MKTLRGFVGILVGLALVLASVVVAAQTWEPLTHQPSFNPGAMLLLTDGTVFVHSEPNCLTCTSTDYSSWYKLTPDSNGSYVNGTWTQMASLPNGYAPLYFGSAVLPDGRVIVEGGEYNCASGSCNSVWTNQGAIYDPLKNSWTPVPPPKSWTTIGDAQSVILPNGTYMQANCCTKQQALFNPTNLTWTPTGSGKFDINDEEGWTLLPNGKLLTVDAYVFQYDATGTNSEIYNPAKGAWTSAGSTIAQLWDSCGGADAASYEVGPAVLRPDGTVLATGANTCGSGHTAIYNSHTGTWRAGPDFPAAYGVADAPAALEPNGNVLVFSSPSRFYPPAGEFFEWNGASLTLTSAPISAATDASYVGHLLILPTGQIMFTDFTTDVEIFTPAGTYDPAWAPTISSAPTSVTRGKTYTISGTQFNGLSQGAAYGDDFQDATNYPLVRIVNAGTGHVFYCPTHNPSTMAVATGSKKVSTDFDVPANVEAGLSQLFVVANGIPSSPYWLKVR
jgi:hypothetical protein